MTEAQEYLALELFDIGAVKFGAYELKHHETDSDAPLSPIYFNLRTHDNPKPGPLTPELLWRIGDLLYCEILQLDRAYDHIVGIPNAGDFLADTYCDVAGNEESNQLYFFKELEGEKRQIGQLWGAGYDPGQTVLLIDDLISKAKTKLEAIQSVEAAGLKVAGVLVLIDREQGGRQQLEEAGYKFFAVYQLSDLLELYVANDLIDQEKADEVLGYIKANS